MAYVCAPANKSDGTTDESSNPQTFVSLTNLPLLVPLFGRGYFLLIFESSFVPSAILVEFPFDNLDITEVIRATLIIRGGIKLIGETGPIGGLGAPTISVIFAARIPLIATPIGPRYNPPK